MSVTFKCKASGNFVTFKHDVDIISMRMHSEYEEVKPAEDVVEESSVKAEPRKGSKKSVNKEAN